MFNSLQPHGLQHARLLCPPLSPRLRSNSCPLNQWCYLTISSSATPFSFCLQSFPGSGPFPISRLLHFRCLLSLVAQMVKEIQVDPWVGKIPGWGRSPGEGKGNPVQYSCLRIPRIEESSGLQSMGDKESDTTE